MLDRVIFVFALKILPYSKRLFSNDLQLTAMTITAVIFIIVVDTQAALNDDIKLIHCSIAQQHGYMGSNVDLLFGDT